MASKEEREKKEGIEGQICPNEKVFKFLEAAEMAEERPWNPWRNQARSSADYLFCGIMRLYYNNTRLTLIKYKCT